MIGWENQHETHQQQGLYLNPHLRTYLERRNLSLRGILQAIFGENSYMVRQLSSWDVHISQYEHTYIESKANDEKISSKVVYVISLRIHIFLQSCIHAHGTGNVSFPSFKDLQDSIVFRTMSITLPMSFQQSINPTLKRKNNENNEALKRAKEKGSTNIVNGDPVYNTTPAHPSVLLRSQEKASMTITNILQITAIMQWSMVHV